MGDQAEGLVELGPGDLHLVLAQLQGDHLDVELQHHQVRADLVVQVPGEPLPLLLVDAVPARAPRLGVAREHEALDGRGQAYEGEGQGLVLDLLVEEVGEAALEVESQGGDHVFLGHSPAGQGLSIAFQGLDVGVVVGGPEVAEVSPHVQVREQVELGAAGREAAQEPPPLRPDPLGLGSQPLEGAGQRALDPGKQPGQGGAPHHLLRRSPTPLLGRRPARAGLPRGHPATGGLGVTLGGRGLGCRVALMVAMSAPTSVPSVADPL